MSEGTKCLGLYGFARGKLYKKREAVRVGSLLFVLYGLFEPGFGGVELDGGTKDQASFGDADLVMTDFCGDFV